MRGIGRLSALAAAAVALCLAGAAGAQEARGRHIAVTGEGQVSAKPDMAHVRVGVREQAPEAQAALEAASSSMQQVLSRLEKAGLARSDIQTGSLRLSPIYGERRPTETEPDRGPRIVAYEASSMLDLRITDLDGMGDLLDAAVGEGANELGEIRFDVSEPQALQDEARRAAVEDAMDRARLYAEAAGAELGRLISITEQGGGGGPVPMAEARFATASDASMPIAPGEIEIGQTVRLVVGLRGDEAGRPRERERERPREAPEDSEG